VKPTIELVADEEARVQRQKQLEKTVSDLEAELVKADAALKDATDKATAARLAARTARGRRGVLVL
jgi:hypothetical protein